VALADAKTAFREALGSYVQLDRLDDEIADTFPASDPFTPDRENGDEAQGGNQPAPGTGATRPSAPVQVTL
jgi:aconitate hydratase